MNRSSSMQGSSMRNELTDPVTSEPPKSTTSMVSQDHSLYQVWTLWDHSFFELCSADKKNKQTDRQTRKSYPRRPRVSVGNKWLHGLALLYLSEYCIPMSSADEEAWHCYIHRSTKLLTSPAICRHSSAHSAMHRVKLRRLMVPTCEIACHMISTDISLNTFRKRLKAFLFDTNMWYSIFADIVNSGFISDIIIIITIIFINTKLTCLPG